MDDLIEEHGIARLISRVASYKGRDEKGKARPRSDVNYREKGFITAFHGLQLTSHYPLQNYFVAV
jgi:hypothetical protein